jgi:hypothetical protein
VVCNCPAIIVEQCANGTTAPSGKCVQSATGACSWEPVGCPGTDAGPPPMVDAGPPPAKDAGTPPTKDAGTTPPTCTPTQCGPEPGMPNTICWDGSIAGPTGVCLENADGVCGWQIRTCPPAPDAGTGCTSDSDCPSTDLCGFLIADGCTAIGSCVTGTRSGPVCLVDEPGCTCDGGTINLACNGYPVGYASAPVAHSGLCTSAGSP